MSARRLHGCRTSELRRSVSAHRISEFASAATLESFSASKRGSGEKKTPPFVELHIVSAGTDGSGSSGNFREGFAENVLTLPGCGSSEPENWISQKAPPAPGEADQPKGAKDGEKGVRLRPKGGKVPSRRHLEYAEPLECS